MLDDILLAHYMDSFFGYGNTKARLWFIGMEEGGGGTVEEVASRIAAWDQRGRPMVDDVAEFHRAFGQHSWFEPGARTQPTWRQLIRASLAASSTHGLPVELEAIREHQITAFARLGGPVASLELLPLPSASTKPNDWKYAGWSAIPDLASRGGYEQRYLPTRIAQLRKKIAHFKPRIVVFYGVTYRPHWEAICGAEFGVGEYPQGQVVDGTSFFLVPHPTAKPRNKQAMRTSACYEALGRAIAEM